MLFLYAQLELRIVFGISSDRTVVVGCTQYSTVNAPGEVYRGTEAMERANPADFRSAEVIEWLQ